MHFDNAVGQTFLRVDEAGTEAAAAAAVVVAEAAAPAPTPIFFFRADEPFLFALRDTRTGMILFMGRVADPRSRSALTPNPMRAKIVSTEFDARHDSVERAPRAGCH